MSEKCCIFAVRFRTILYTMITMEEHDNMAIKAMFAQMGAHESLYDAMYRKAASVFGLSACEMWIFYFLLIEPKGVTQQQICRQMMSPKQTINTAVARLAGNGMLSIDTEKHKNKMLRLTPKGYKFAQGTVGRMQEAEMWAVQCFGYQKLARLCKLQGEYYETIKKEFDATFLNTESNVKQ